MRLKASLPISNGSCSIGNYLHHHLLPRIHCHWVLAWCTAPPTTPSTTNIDPTSLHHISKIKIIPAVSSRNKAKVCPCVTDGSTTEQSNLFMCLEIVRPATSISTRATTHTGEGRETRGSRRNVKVDSYVQIFAQILFDYFL